MSRFNRTNFFKVYFIYPNGQTKWRPMTLNSFSQFEHDGKTYDFNMNCVKYEKTTPVIHYYYNVPNPINYSMAKNNNVDVVLDGSTYHEVMKAKIIRNLVQEGLQMKMVLILLAFIAVVIVVLALYQMGLLDGIIPVAGEVAK